MLFEETVESRTMALLKELSQVPLLKQFHLAWWTNLSLRFGYRISVDLDFFTNQEFDHRAIAEYLTEHYWSFRPNLMAANTLTWRVDDIKVDFILQRAEVVEAFELIDGVSYWSVPDVCAMKCSAILGRWVKKDYRDIAHLLKYYSVAQILEFFSKKYPRGDQGTVIRVLTYFDDAEKDTRDVDPLDDMTRPKVKKIIQKGVREYFEKEI